MNKIDIKKRKKMNPELIDEMLVDKNVTTSRKWNLKNREEKNMYNKIYYQKNKQKIIKQVCANQKIKRSVINERRKIFRKNKLLLEIQINLLLPKSKLKLVTIDDWRINY